MMVSADGATSTSMLAIQLSEANTVSNLGGSAQIEVWPSGQVELSMGAASQPVQESQQ
jgi:hypothetical protein